MNTDLDNKDNLDEMDAEQADRFLNFMDWINRHRWLIPVTLVAIGGIIGIILDCCN